MRRSPVNLLTRKFGTEVGHMDNGMASAWTIAKQASWLSDTVTEE